MYTGTQGRYIAKANLIQTSVDKTDYRCCKRTNGLCFGFCQQSQQNVFSGGSKSCRNKSAVLIIPSFGLITEGEKGETSLVECNIDTGDSHPIKQAAQRVPFAAQEEIVAQLRKMQDEGVIQPS